MDAPILFQSTRPMRGATKDLMAAGRDAIVSIHAPHAGRDPFAAKISDGYAEFQSTRPMRGATLKGLQRKAANVVSIHAPHAGRDEIHIAMYWGCMVFQSTRPMRGATSPTPTVPKYAPSFNPRAPCGARQQKRSRLPSSATYLWVFPSTNTIFSAPKTHAPPAA